MPFTKNIDEIKIGIAISTYTEEKTEPKRYEIIDRSLKSLQKVLKTTKINTYVVIIVDGKVPDKHINLLKKYDFNVYIRPKNGGVARTKNTSIRLLLEQNVDIGFLADDDLLYKNNCIDVYANFICKTECHHLIASYPHPKVHPDWNKMNYILDNYKGQKIRRHGGGVGYFMSFTSKLIEKIGYFKILPGKFGSEHINFSKRVIKMGMADFHMDIDESVNYVEHIGFWPIAENLYGKCHSISKKNQKKSSQQNKKYVNVDLNKKIELIE
jgi:hypothetical protein